MTILPVMNAYKTARQLTDIVLVVDASKSPRPTTSHELPSLSTATGYPSRASPRTVGRVDATETSRNCARSTHTKADLLTLSALSSCS